MPTIKGLAVRDPDGTLLGWQAECCYCQMQSRLAGEQVVSECEHLVAVGICRDRVTFDFAETDDERRDREYDQEINRRILQEVEERR